MNDLLIWFFFLSIIFVVYARRRRQRAPDENPVLGYRRLEGEQLLLNPLLSALTRGPWTFLTLEDMPFAQRRRVILSIAASPDDIDDATLEPFLWRAASHIQRRAQAHVVVVEAFEAASQEQRTGEGRMRLLYAPDGLGWSGEERILAAVDGHKEPMRTLDLRGVHQALLEVTDAAS